MKTLVFGGSIKPERYSNKAIKSLQEKGVSTVSYGLKPGIVAGISMDTTLVAYDDIHTITLYMNPKRQKEFYDYFLSLCPKRIIFNPGTENQELASLARANGIAVQEACTLVLLSMDQYE